MNNATDPSYSSTSTFTISTLKNGDVVSVVLNSNETCKTKPSSDPFPAAAVSVSELAVVSVSVSGTPNICSGDIATYTATPQNGGSKPKYQWYVNKSKAGLPSENPVFTSTSLKDSDTIRVEMSNVDLTCKTAPSAMSTNAVTIVVVETPVAVINDGSPYIEINDAKALVLSAALSTPATATYTWSASTDANADAAIQSRNAVTTKGTVFSTNTTYELLVQNGACYATSSVLVNLKLLVKIPTAFSPNADNNHDFLEIPDLVYFPRATVTIFNQWGETVYKSAAPYQPWDGKRNGTEVGESTYYYIIEFNEPGAGSKTGYVTLIR